MEKLIFGLIIGSLIATSQLTMAGDWRGNIALESRFYNEPGDFGQNSQQYSSSFEPEFNHSFEQSSSAFSIQALFRKDSMDEQRTHADLRELSWLTYGDTWEFKAGISKVFWGVAESKHLVDIINQTDAVENIDGENKLGQPMLQLTLISDMGNLGFFVLPWFRERTFPGVEGRFRAPIVIDTEKVLYASSDEQEHIDGAIRWSHTLGDWDIGIAHFSGTSREPIFVPAMTTTGPVLQPLYNTIDQTSLDLQATIGSCLWKLEMISNSGFDRSRYLAAVGGIEYSFYDVAESGIDIGVILEYQFDDRKVDINGTKVLDVIVTGARLAFNDEQSTEILLGLSINEKAHNYFWNIEASRRLGDSWKVTLEARIISNIDDFNPALSPFFSVRNDSFIMIELARYF